jgi:predicted nucleic acid-binding protein
VNLVDSSAWLEYLADGPNAQFFAPAIEKTSELIVPTIVVFEVFKRVLQQRSARAALETVAILRQGRFVELTDSLAIVAATMSVREKLPMADSIIIATARSENAVIWTQDVDFERLPAVKFRAKKR